MFRLSGLVLVVAAALLAVGVAHAQTLTTLVSFSGSNGEWPHGGLTVVGNTLYGTTEEGGAYGWGTVFSVPASGGSPTVLASFNITNTNAYQPRGGVTLSGSTLYGTTCDGGAYGYGTVFSVPVSGGSPTTLASLSAYTNGAFPESGLTLSGNTLYGTAWEGGNVSLNSGQGCGTVFSVPVSGGSPTVLASFDGSNGQCPYPCLTLIGNTLYGTTNQGGTTGWGTVFSVPVSGGSPTVLASFNDSNGAYPVAGLTLSGNTLYGATCRGGNLFLNSGQGCGTVFSVPVSGGSPTVLASFDGSNGQYPEGDLTLIGNALYGTTEEGGAYGDGTVFSVPVSGGSPTVLVSFNGSDGENPLNGGLTLIGNTLYGTTLVGGAYGDGTVFALTVPEPSTIALLLASAASLLAFAWRQRRVK